MTQDQIAQTVKDIQAQVQAGNIKAQLTEWVKDGSVIDQLKQADLDADPTQADLIVGCWEKVKHSLQNLITLL